MFVSVYVRERDTYDVYVYIHQYIITHCFVKKIASDVTYSMDLNSTTAAYISLLSFSKVSNFATAKFNDLL